MDRSECRENYRKLTETLIKRGLSVTTMESCTGGLVASLITDTEGSSEIMKGAFVTYSNEAKIRCGVPEDIIERFGIYSEETAKAMAAAAKDFYAADIAIAVTGSFGRPDPNNPGSVPGEIYFAIDYNGARSYKVELSENENRPCAKISAATLIAAETLRLLDETSVSS